jgi:hypothetical protein
MVSILDAHETGMVRSEPSPKLTETSVCGVETLGFSGCPGLFLSLKLPEVSIFLSFLVAGLAETHPGVYSP